MAAAAAAASRALFPIFLRKCATCQIKIYWSVTIYSGGGNKQLAKLLFSIQNATLQKGMA